MIAQGIISPKITLVTRTSVAERITRCGDDRPRRSKTPPCRPNRMRPVHHDRSTASSRPFRDDERHRCGRTAYTRTTLRPAYTMRSPCPLAIVTLRSHVSTQLSSDDTNISLSLLPSTNTVIRRSSHVASRVGSWRDKLLVVSK